MVAKKKGGSQQSGQSNSSSNRSNSRNSSSSNYNRKKGAPQDASRPQQQRPTNNSNAATAAWGTKSASSSLASAASGETTSPPTNNKPVTKPAAGGVWGSNSNSMAAVRSAPPPSFAAAAASQKPKPQDSGKWNKQQSRKGGPRQQGGGNQRSNRPNSNQRQNNRPNSNQRQNRSGGGKHQQRGSQKALKIVFDEPLELIGPDEGTTKLQEAVKRISYDAMLACRLLYLDAPSSDWNPPEACAWIAEERVEEIEQVTKAKRMSGEVSSTSRKGPVETAPPLEECKPLEVNEETRWKSKAFTGVDDQEEEDSDEVILKKAFLILNKLSLTKFDKLSQDFYDTGIYRSKECLEGAIGLIINKAQQEPHFSSMYAQLCFALNNKEYDFDSSSKVFKKLLLSKCQEGFEVDMDSKIETIRNKYKDPEEIEYHVNLLKKEYLGHVQFIGELYKGDLVKIEIMLWCLEQLLEGEEEEKMKCFCKLMATTGSSLEGQSMALANAGKESSSQKLNECWDTVEKLAHKESNVSNRVKFMLQDLLEMRDKGWVTRRKEEKAKTIEQIHAEVAKEERRAARRSSSISSMGGSSRSLGRRASSGDVRILDKDGFTQVSSKKMPALNRSVSDVTMSRSSKPQQPPPRRPSSSKLMRSVSESNAVQTQQKKKKEYPSPAECGKKACSILKEFFVGGDLDDAVLSMDELIGGKDADGSVDRGAKVVEASVLMVMERKDEDVTKMIKVFNKCISENKLPQCLVQGLQDPLEFLGDIVVDAPLADRHLAKIIVAWIQLDVLNLTILTKAPAYFYDGGKAAQLAVRVCKSLPENEEHLKVVEQCMTDKEKEEYGSAQAMLDKAT